MFERWRGHPPYFHNIWGWAWSLDPGTQSSSPMWVTGTSFLISDQCIPGSVLQEAWVRSWESNRDTPVWDMGILKFVLSGRPKTYSCSHILKFLVVSFCRSEDHLSLKEKMDLFKMHVNLLNTYSEELVNNSTSYRVIAVSYAHFCNISFFFSFGRKMILMSKNKNKNLIVLFELECEISTDFV